MEGTETISTNTPLNQQCGFHVKQSTQSPVLGVVKKDSRAQEVQQSALSFGAAMTPSMPSVPSAATTIPASKLYRISGLAKTRLAPSSMSPGLAVSQGDMTLAEHSHLTPGVKKMMRSVVRGLKAYQEPEAATEGLGGTYFFKSETGSKIAIMKPCDEEPMAPSNPKGFRGRKLGEPGLKPTVRVGEAASREVAAYLLDHDNFAGVPHTVMVRMAHPIFHYDEGLDADAGGDVETNDIARLSQQQLGTVAGDESAKVIVTADADGSTDLPLKLGSLQNFVRHECDTTEMGSKLFHKKDVHRIGILDVRLFNTDRHGGNILVQKVAGNGACAFGGLSAGLNQPFASQPQYKLVPIDHGFALPEGLEPPYYEWQHWPQAMMPFDKEELDYIASLDAHADVDLLRKELPDIHEASFRVLELSTLLLQRCAAAGLTLSEIAGVMTRPMIGIDEEPSELERMCFEIRQEMHRENVERRMESAEKEGSVRLVERAASRLSSMMIDEDAVDSLKESPDAESVSTYFSFNPDTDASVAARKTTAEDALFSMDEENGTKTPSPSSPQGVRKEGMYNEAPTLRVKATGEVEHLSTPFGTTFKSVLGSGAGSSPSYDSESPTHQNDGMTEEEVLSGYSNIKGVFRGAQSYAPTLSKFPITATTTIKPRKNSSAVARTTTMDAAMDEPRGCREPSFVLKDLNDQEWEVFMSKAAEKIADKLASGAWVDSFGAHQMPQMSCPV